MELAEYLENITSKLNTHFDIQREYILNAFTYDVFAEHHLRTDHYLLSKKFVLESIQANELCFIKHYSSLDENAIQEFTETLIQSIPSLIHLDDGHMSTIITGVVVTDYKPSDALIQTIKRFAYHKGFRLGLKGWVDIRLLLVTLKQDYIVANKKGRDVLQVYSITKNI